jgi:hypothetical protein
MTDEEEILELKKEHSSLEKRSRRSQNNLT